MDNILPCPMCGSPADLLSSGAAEIYGHQWQHLSIECTDVKDEHCGMYMEIQADFHNIKNATKVILSAWNELDRK